MFLGHHSVMLLAAVHLPIAVLPGPSFVWIFALTLALTWAVAGLSYRLVEQPFMRLRRGA